MKKNTPTPAPVVQKHSQRGKYVYKPLVSTVLACKCGNKYIATRPKQRMCIRCIQEA